MKKIHKLTNAAIRLLTDIRNMGNASVIESTIGRSRIEAMPDTNTTKHPNRLSTSKIAPDNR
jgi:hypothetical protein